MSSSTVHVDVLFVGGGIAGLWLLNCVRQAGYSALLVESERIGAGQSGASQGFVVHRPRTGATVPTDKEAAELASVVGRWRELLAGRAVPDLSGVRVLSEHPLRWTLPEQPGRSLLDRLLRRSPPLPDAAAETGFDIPGVLRHPMRRGSLSTQEGFIVDNRSLLGALLDPVRDALVHTQGAAVMARDGGFNLRIEEREPVVVRARRTVYTTGVGANLLGSVSLQVWHQQMVMIRGEGLADDLYINAVNEAGRRLFNISSHRDLTGRPVWYYGGAMVESGEQVDAARQIRNCRRDLGAHFPWLALSGLEFAAHRVDRAAVRMRNGLALLPQLRVEDQRVVAWPTNLSTMPLLGDRMLAMLRREGIEPRPADLHLLADWPQPALAPAPWDEEAQTWQS